MSEIFKPIEKDKEECRERDRVGMREGDRLRKGVKGLGRDKGRRDKGEGEEGEERACGIKGMYGATITAIAIAIPVTVGGDTIEETKTKIKMLVLL
jgi:hypothetical protein